MAPEKTPKYHVLEEVSLPLKETADHAAGSLTFAKDSTFDPVVDGFDGTAADIEALVAEGKIAEVYDGPMTKYKIIGKIESLTQEGEPSGVFLEIGSIHELPAGALAEEVEKGNAEEVKEDGGEVVTDGANTADVVDTAPVEKAHFYMGKQIISDTMRKVEDKFYHHIRLEDGSSHDLTKEEYADVMAA